MTAPTFPDVLADHVRRSGSRPLVTFYDDATGERVELSVVTYANWVAKTAGVLQDEVGLERGDTVLVDLPIHWLAPVWLGACWSTGLAVRSPGSSGSDLTPADLVVCGPDGVEEHAAAGARVVALSLDPMGRRFTEPLPDGVVDFGVVVWGQPDSFVAYDPPEATDVAWQAERPSTQEDLLRASAGHAWSAPGTRLLTDAPTTSEDGLLAFLAPLLGGGGTVWVAHPDPAGWEHRATAEHVTAVHREGAPGPRE